MKIFHETLINLAICGVLGSMIGATAMFLIGETSDDNTGKTNTTTQKEPLYWVAPMDANYRRDKPGKSPMGMDLVPVYEKEGEDQEVGTVSISPVVVNNLGVRTAPVTLGQLKSTVKTVGYVQYNENHLIHIHPRVEGWIEKLYVKAAGDPVEKGEPLYALYSPTLVNAQEEFLLAQKRNNPTLISAAMERLIALQIPQADIRRLKQTRKVNQTITIKAPQSGVLDKLNAREGMYIKPGMEVMAIGQLEHIWVIGEVFERQAASVQVGDTVTMWMDYLPGQKWNGTVNYIYPALNSKTRTAQVRIHFDNPAGSLRPGMFAQIAIDTTPSKASLIIPREALIRTGSQSRIVLAKGGGHFKSVAVVVGKMGENQIEILSGLKVGERIVTSAQFLIDSESSKTSDFKRMDLVNEAHDNTATVKGVVNVINRPQRLLNISRDPIEKWQRPAATLDFIAGSDVNIDSLKEGNPVRFTFQVDGREFTIIQIQSDVSLDTSPDTPMDEHAHKQNNGDHND